MTIALVWFRQDLRVNDNPAFLEACSHYEFVIPLYIFDDGCSVSGRAQAWWLHHSLIALDKALHELGLNLVLRQGNPLDVISELIDQLSVKAIYWNRCYEPLSIKRDKIIKTSLQERGIKVQSFNGNLFHEPWTIKNNDGNFFKVFTPYWKKCRQFLDVNPPKNSMKHPKKVQIDSDRLADWRLLPARNWASQFKDYWIPGEVGAQKTLDEFIANHLSAYKKNKDFPAVQATSRLSPHLHFGEISPWTILRAIELAKLEPGCNLESVEHFLSELGWREFSVYLLYHFPKLSSENFRGEFDSFPWHDNKEALVRWQKGITGYPIVDAGMRELWATGYMHNRVRMIVASFLTKDLLIDWRLGADWFLDTLVDADLASNSVSWQWVAGCGADAAPYFRIFNPVLQSQKFDPDGMYIRRWVPELSQLSSQSIHAPWENEYACRTLLGTKYPRPIINHHEARDRALSYYKRIKR